MAPLFCVSFSITAEHLLLQRLIEIRRAGKALMHRRTILCNRQQHTFRQPVQHQLLPLKVVGLRKVQSLITLSRYVISEPKEVRNKRATINGLPLIYTL